MMRSRYILASIPLILLFIAGTFTVGWERPPMETEQYGYRGLGMEGVTNPRTAADMRTYLASEMPDPIEPVESGGPRASSQFQNVKVLGDLSVEEFNRHMLAITQWVSPEEGCGYCHNLENLASDEKYTKVVARRMLQMTREVNSKWKTHVAETGVTCYTCHRGKPVPENIWFSSGEATSSGFAASSANQNIASDSVGATSLPYDFFSAHLADAKPENIRVVGEKALPQSGKPGASIQQTEKTYGLMMHISQSLGVNCSFCHNSRSFYDWNQSTKPRVTAWHGLNMVRALNETYLVPLKDTFPKNRLGPLGDVPKLNCATCHGGASKPLMGQSMLKDHPELAGN